MSGLSLTSNKKVNTTADMATGGGGCIVPWLDINEWTDRRSLKRYELNEFQTFDIDVNDIGNADKDLIFQIRQQLHDKYNKVTSVLLDMDRDLQPKSYCHYQEMEKPSTLDYKKISCSGTSWPLFGECMSFWRYLSDDAQDGLLLLLASVRAIFHRILYINESWLPMVGRSRDRRHMSHLTYYDREIENGSHKKGAFAGIWEDLGRGRSQQELKETLKRVKRTAWSCSIEDAWCLGLISGMFNGLGHTAVQLLLNNITCLISSIDDCEVFPDGLPKIVCGNVTSSTNADDFSIDTCSSPQKTRSTESSNSSSTHPPKPKKLKRDSQKEPAPKNEEVVLPNKDLHFVDLHVACIHLTTGIAKYLILIEIHSRGETVDEAKRKFRTEVFHVLQAQNIIFGLFFSERDVYLFTAKKRKENEFKDDPNADEFIEWDERVYSLVEDDSVTMRLESFCVKNFQLLIMDIFACLMYGMKHIVA